jgi:hypothetical protein
MDPRPLARALGLPPELVERAAHALYEEHRHRREAARALRPFMVNALALYLEKGARLQEAIFTARSSRL